jgi:hypothetical protein
VKIRRKLEEIRVVLINSNFSETRSSEFADDNCHMPADTITYMHILTALGYNHTFTFQTKCTVCQQSGQITTAA